MRWIMALICDAFLYLSAKNIADSDSAEDILRIGRFYMKFAPFHPPPPFDIFVMLGG